MNVIDGLAEPETRDHYAMLDDAERMLKAGVAPDDVAADLQRGSTLSPHWF